MDAVASQQNYFYATSYLTMHPVASTNVLTGFTELQASGLKASTFCPQEKGFVDPEDPPEQLMLPGPSAFFREGSVAERAFKRFHREEARTRYLVKRRKRVAAEAAKGLRPGRQKKHESRTRIAHNRPRVRGRFIKADDPASRKQQQDGYLHQAHDNERLASSEEIASGAVGKHDSDARQQQHAQHAQQQRQQEGQPQWMQQFGQDGRMSIW